VRTALEEGLALRIDRREPAAHLTLGRAERGGRAALDRVVAAFAGRSISWEARGMVLYSSALGRGGPTYTVERAWRFGPPEGPPAGGAA
jgi:2'-5' RNA ligase